MTDELVREIADRLKSIEDRTLHIEKSIVAINIWLKMPVYVVGALGSVAGFCWVSIQIITKIHSMV